MYKPSKLAQFVIHFLFCKYNKYIDFFANDYSFSEIFSNLKSLTKKNEIAIDILLCIALLLMIININNNNGEHDETIRSLSLSI